ncbi:MAG: aldo/keto reductase [Candidatus Rokubacteria bacterium]|nr:aldo/keto reductase [Candidatus Rokubacteria bacterium]
MGIRGCATREGTAAYETRMGSLAAAGHFRHLGGLGLSSLGIGTYLGREDAATDEEYCEAVARALGLGINVVDTAVNYRHQRSERAIGVALARLIGNGTLRREEVVLATKGGFLPFDSAVPPNAGAYLTDTYVRSGILRADEVVGGCHSLAPRYLADQLERSRANLGVDTIDIYYLHNPEMELSEVDRPTFIRRLRAAFEALENAVAASKIRAYGAATWTGFRQPADAPEHLALADLVAVAREVGGSRHHFAVIQLPMNLGMTEAATLANQLVDGRPMSVLEAARLLDVYVMTSASLHQGQLARGLPPILGEVLTGLKSDAERALQFVRSTPGVGTALVGMRQVGHVEENARLVGTPPVSWDRFQQLFRRG